MYKTIFAVFAVFLSSCSSHNDTVTPDEAPRNTANSSKQRINDTKQPQPKQYAILIEGRPGWVRNPHSAYSEPWYAADMPEGVAIRSDEGVYYIPKLPPIPAKQPLSYPPKAVTDPN